MRERYAAIWDGLAQASGAINLLLTRAQVHFEYVPDDKRNGFNDEQPTPSHTPVPWKAELSD